LDINRTHGLTTSNFIMINCPLNALLIMVLVSGKFNLKTGLIMFLIGLNQAFVLFGTQLFLALLGRLLHKPAKPFLALSVRCSKFGSLDLRTRLKLTRYLEQFHSVNQYTVNYGRYGKITFQS